MDVLKEEINCCSSETLTALDQHSSGCQTSISEIQQREKLYGIELNELESVSMQTSDSLRNAVQQQTVAATKAVEKRTIEMRKISASVEEDVSVSSIVPKCRLRAIF